MAGISQAALARARRAQSAVAAAAGEQRRQGSDSAAPVCPGTLTTVDHFTLGGAARSSPICFVLGLPHVTLVELRLALISYQGYRMLH